MIKSPPDRLLQQVVDQANNDIGRIDETSVQELSASGPANATTTFVDASGGAVTVELPEPRAGLLRVVKKTDASANAVTIDGGTYTIDGAATKSTTVQYTAYSLRGSGSEWFLV